MKLTQNDISILRTLIQDHLNTLSELSLHYVQATSHVSILPYLDELRKLELKLIRKERRK